MQTQKDQQASIIKQQQQFLEAMDRRERETKLVVLGDTRIRGHRRLGKRNTNKKRPILVEVD